MIHTAAGRRLIGLLTALTLVAAVAAPAAAVDGDRVRRAGEREACVGEPAARQPQ